MCPFVRQNPFRLAALQHAPGHEIRKPSRLHHASIAGIPIPIVRVITSPVYVIHRPALLNLVVEVNGYVEPLMHDQTPPWVTPRLFFQYGKVGILEVRNPRSIVVRRSVKRRIVRPIGHIRVVWPLQGFVTRFGNRLPLVVDVH